jgi:hypothetical protein
MDYRRGRARRTSPLPGNGRHFGFQTAEAFAISDPSHFGPRICAFWYLLIPFQPILIPEICVFIRFDASYCLRFKTPRIAKAPRCQPFANFLALRRYHLPPEKSNFRYFLYLSRLEAPARQHIAASHGSLTQVAPTVQGRLKKDRIRAFGRLAGYPEWRWQGHRNARWHAQLQKSGRRADYQSALQPTPSGRYLAVRPRAYE